jgi:hypothetical protein
MPPWHRSRRHHPPLHWRQLGVFTAQVRAAAATAGFPAVILPDRRIGSGADAWAVFFETADWTALEHARTALVRLRGPRKEFPA